VAIFLTLGHCSRPYSMSIDFSCQAARA
jgi:hypothetical protein